MKMNSILCNDKGTSMLEYALVAPMFFLLLLGTFEVAAIFFVQTSLDAAVFRASRFGRTGDVEPGKSQTETVREIINRLTYGMLDTTRIHLRIKPAADFASMQVSEVNQDEIDFGGPNQPVVYTVTYAL